jgi:pyruvate kinase
MSDEKSESFTNNRIQLQRRDSRGPERFGQSLPHVGSDVDLAANYTFQEQGTDPYENIFAELQTKAEWSSIAHRACINPLRDNLRVAGSPDDHPVRKTGIICTIGPNTNSPQALADLRKAGMNIMRMNFSHGDHAYHYTAIENLRKSFELLPGPPVAIALDTKGPEIRTGNMRSGEVELRAGTMLTVTTNIDDKNNCDETLIYVDYVNLPIVVEVGSYIFIDDGLISLRVVEIAADRISIKAEVVNTGKLNSKKGVNLPGIKVDLPSISEQDARDLVFGVENGVDMIFASFIRKREDVLAIRKVLGEKGRRIMIVSKIENQEGVQRFDEVLSESDGIMVARGDLGIEIPVQKVFLAQKMMIARCNIVGKPVICATQMLESMTFNPRPTRAEVSDVGNAVIDGADCVMLSGETAKGKYPYDCVRIMNEICVEAESTLHFLNFSNQIHSLNRHKHTNETLAAAAVSASFEQDVQALIVLSISGNTARLVAKYRPQCPIICITTDQITSRQLHLTRGVYPVYCPLPYDSNSTTWPNYIDSMVAYGIRECARKGMRMLKAGDIAIVVQGWTSSSGHTNTLRVIRI